MANFTKEQEEALARARARMQAKGSTGEGEDGVGPMPFFNKSLLVDLGGAPVDLTNWLMKKAGIPVSEEPFAGSKSIERGLEAVGIDIPDRGPRTTSEFVGQVGGEAAGFTLPMMKGAQKLQQGKGVVGGMARAMNREVVERPIRSLAAEAGGATGAGVARSATNDADISEGGKVAAEVVGGISGALGGTGLVSAVRNAPTPAMIRRVMFPFTEKGALERASARIQSLVDDPVKAAGMIEDLKGSSLRPSARTESPGLMALEKTVLERDPAEHQRVAQRTADAVSDLIGNIRQSGNVKSAREFVKAKRDRLISSMDARVEMAAEKAARQLEYIDPNMTPADASVIVRESIEQALNDAKVQEAALWQAIPQGAPVSTRAVSARLKDIEAVLPAAQYDDVPQIARNIINNFKDVESVLELDGLYKKLGEVGRKARASGDFNQARITDDLRDSILQDMSTAKGGKEVKEAIDTARQFSLELNQRFRRGNVGRVLGYAREGGSAIDPTLTLESTVGKRGQKGALAVEDIKKATQWQGVSDDPLALEGVQNYLKARFVRDVITDGKYSPTKAASFMKQNEELLSKFPALKWQLEAARSSDDVARRVAKTTDARRKALDRKSVSSAANFLGAPVDRAIGQIMASNEPSQMMAELMKMTAQNSDAHQGMKAGMSEWLLDQAISTNKTDITGRPVIDGLKLQNIFGRDTVQDVLKKVFSEDELKSIQKSVKELALFDRQERTKTRSGEIINDAVAKIFEIPARIGGARLFSKFTSNAGTSIQSAQIGSREAKRFLQRLSADKARQLIIDAIEDPELMRALLLNPSKKSGRVVAKRDRVLRSYLASRGARLLDDEEQQ